MKTAGQKGMAIISAPAEKAEELARALVREKLAACVQVTSNVVSLYWWEGKVERDEERLLFLKTDEDRMGGIEAFLKGHHPYDVPELLFFPASAGSAAYLRWMGENLA